MMPVVTEKPLDRNGALTMPSASTASNTLKLRRLS